MGFKARPLQVIVGSKLIVAGVLALDDLKTPKRSEKGIVGGAGVYSSIASSFFTSTALIAAIGNDFPNNITATLKEKKIDLDCVKKLDYPTFHWSGEYVEVYSRRKDKRRTCGRPMASMLQVRAGGLEKRQGAVVACCMVLGNDKEATLGHLDTQTIQEVLDGDKYKELIKAHEEERFDDISYCKNCDQLWNVPESLIWTNIEDVKYNHSHIVGDLRLAKFS